MEQPREPKYNPTDRANKDIQRAYEELTNPNMLEIEKIDYLFQYERIIKAVSKDILRLIYTIKEEDKEEDKEAVMDIASGIYGQLYQLILDEDLAWYCTAHWLSCLYSDYLYERVAGEQFPCGTCERKKECTVENKTSPTGSFLPLIKRTGVKIKHMFSPEEEEERLKEIKENRRKRGQAEK